MPIRQRGGVIALYRWGARGSTYFAADNLTGWSARFPEGGWASLEEIRAGKWAWLEPRPVRILAARFIRVNSWQVPCYFSLQLGEFIQGLLASITHHKRVYVATVPAPAEHAEQWAEWPKIVSAKTRT